MGSRAGLVNLEKFFSLLGLELQLDGWLMD